MDNLKIVPADTGDLLPVQKLLSEAGLPHEDIVKHLKDFLLAKQDGMIIGTVGLEVLGELGLLRSLAVAGEHRGKRIGNILHESMISYACRQGIKQIYALTLTIEGFLQQRGFYRIARDDAPQPLKETGEFKSLCPVSAICMTRKLGKELEQAMPGDSLQVAIITGAASGIGRAIAGGFAENRYRVFLFDSDCEALNKSVGEFGASPVGYYCGDVSKSEDVQNALARCLSDFGRVDVLVSNAGGILRKVAFLDMDEDLWDRHLAVNLKGAFLWGQAVAKWMVKEHTAGRIINISCIRTELVAPNLSAYSASKGGVKALTKAMAVELAPYGIRVNAIQPGRTMTEGLASFLAEPGRRERLENLIPCHRFAMPEEIANTALFLASDQASYITGAVIPVDGGYTISKE